MVAVLGFPRPLYPPESAPKYDPSANGPDVEAYKRTVSRAGRWPWQAYDQAYSNAFSRGKSGGNVGDSGVAGVQRQGGISPDTGFVGKETFNLLRSIIIPEGLPHAGEHAMDAHSVELVNQAWNRFGGDPAPEPPSGDAGRARLDKAITQIGTKESPSNSNMTKYGEWYGGNGQPWCGYFVSWCDQTGWSPTASFDPGRAYAYVPYIVSDAQLGKNGLSITSKPKAGDLVCFDWDFEGVFDHVGIFEEGSPSSFRTIEGNTSPSDNSNGGEVMRRSRSTSEAAIVFVRVAG
jgi:hypothetical protein